MDPISPGRRSHCGRRIISGCPSGSSGCGILRWNSGQIAGNGQDGVLQREVMKTSGCMSHRQEPSITGSIAARIWSCRSGLWRRRKLRHFAMRTGKHIENACSAGMRKMAFGRLYITNQGDCYHKDLGCSGIKRTVRMIRLSEVGTRRPCSRCGQ